jgi:hypothetical protein
MREASAEALLWQTQGGSAWRESDLVHGAQDPEIRCRDPVRAQWRSKRIERSHDPLCILRTRSDEDVQVAGRTHEPVKRQCMRADDHEVDVAVVQGLDEIREVLIELRPIRHRCPRRIRPGMVARVYSGIGRPEAAQTSSVICQTMGAVVGTSVAGLGCVGDVVGTRSAVLRGMHRHQRDDLRGAQAHRGGRRDDLCGARAWWEGSSGRPLWSSGVPDGSSRRPLRGSGVPNGSSDPRSWPRTCFGELSRFADTASPGTLVVQTPHRSASGRLPRKPCCGKPEVTRAGPSLGTARQQVAWPRWRHADTARIEGLKSVRILDLLRTTARALVHDQGRATGNPEVRGSTTEVPMRRPGSLPRSAVSRVLEA